MHPHDVHTRLPKVRVTSFRGLASQVLAQYTCLVPVGVYVAPQAHVRGAIVSRSPAGLSDAPRMPPGPRLRTVTGAGAVGDGVGFTAARERFTRGAGRGDTRANTSTSSTSGRCPAA